MKQKVLQFLSKPRKFKLLFVIFFLAYLCLMFSGFSHDSADTLEISATLLVFLYVGMSIVGGVIGATMWMIFSKLVSVLFDYKIK